MWNFWLLSDAAFTIFKITIAAEKEALVFDQTHVCDKFKNPFVLCDLNSSQDLLPVELGVNQTHVLTAEIFNFLYLCFFTSGTV